MPFFYYHYNYSLHGYRKKNEEKDDLEEKEKIKKKIT